MIKGGHNFDHMTIIMEHMVIDINITKSSCLNHLYYLKLCKENITILICAPKKTIFSSLFEKAGIF